MKRVDQTTAQSVLSNQDGRYGNQKFLKKSEKSTHSIPGNARKAPLHFMHSKVIELSKNQAGNTKKPVNVQKPPTQPNQAPGVETVLIRRRGRQTREIDRLRYDHK